MHTQKTKAKKTISKGMKKGKNVTPFISVQGIRLTAKAASQGKGPWAQLKIASSLGGLKDLKASPETRKSLGKEQRFLRAESMMMKVKNKQYGLSMTPV